MPAKRSLKKSRKPSAKPSLADVTPPDLDTLSVAPATPLDLPVLPVAETTPPPKAGPLPGRDPRFAGRPQRAGQARRYAFRRS